MKHLLLTLTAIILGLASPAAFAILQDEIQVYTDDITAPGEVGLDVHVNTTPISNVQPAYAGEVLNRHGLRVNPEFSYGLSKTFEAGFYLPLVIDNQGSTRLAGEKIRLKWLPIQAVKPVDWYAGTNFELSRVDYEYEKARRILEMRNILGFRTPTWSVTTNPIFRTGLSRGNRGAPEFELDLRLMRHLSERFQAGVEYYHVFGPVKAVSPFNEQARQVLAVVEADLPKGWKLHLGVGHGWGAADGLTLTSIITVPFN